MGKKEKRPSRFRRVHAHIRKNKPVFLVYLILRLFVISSMVLAVLQGNYESVFTYILVLILFTLPGFVEESFGIELPNTLQIIILLFIFAAEILGELQSYYLHYPYWDTMLHTVNGFLCAAVGYSLVDLLNRDHRTSFNLSPLYLSIVAFCFSMTVGVIWEFFEFGMDRIFHTDMQKDTVVHFLASTYLDPSQSNITVHIENIRDVTVNGRALNVGGYLDIGLLDTMEDLMVNFVGAFVFSVIGYFNAKRHGSGRLIRQLMPRLREEAAPEEAPAPPPEEQAGDRP